jgi:hypothetical protein
MAAMAGGHIYFGFVDVVKVLGEYLCNDVSQKKTSSYKLHVPFSFKLLHYPGHAICRLGWGRYGSFLFLFKSRFNCAIQQYEATVKDWTSRQFRRMTYTGGAN